MDAKTPAEEVLELLRRMPDKVLEDVVAALHHELNRRPLPSLASLREKFKTTPITDPGLLEILKAIEEGRVEMLKPDLDDVDEDSLGEEEE